jgi:hypothetical protein
MAVQPDATQRARQGYTVRAPTRRYRAGNPVVSMAFRPAPERVICLARRAAGGARLVPRGSGESGGFRLLVSVWLPVSPDGIPQAETGPDIGDKRVQAPPGSREQVLDAVQASPLNEPLLVQHPLAAGRPRAGTRQQVRSPAASAERRAGQVTGPRVTATTPGTAASRAARYSTTRVSRSRPSAGTPFTRGPVPGRHDAKGECRSAPAASSLRPARLPDPAGGRVQLSRRR